MAASGSKVKSGDTPPTVNDSEATAENSFTNTSFDSGAVVCGMTFTAPTSGSVLVFWSARFQALTASQRALVSVKVSAGSTIDAGAVVSPAADTSALETTQSATVTGSGATAGPETRMAAGMWRKVDNLSPGQIYNVVVQKKVFGGSGSVFQRDVCVIPIL